jgi:hypothetical protein
MSMRSLLALGALPVLLLSVGCTVGNPDGPDAEAQTTTTATAIVVIERTTAGDAIVARFLRARQATVDDSTVHTSGLQDVPAPGTCVTSFDSPVTAARAVDLLDVGTVTLDATTLLPRAMPDPAGMVSGYFYSARSVEAFTASSRVSLRASGGQDLPEGFAVSVAAPHDLADVLVTPSAAGLDVSWSVSTDADPAETDVVYVDVLAPSMLARCAASDVGRLTIPASAIGNVEEGTLAVHRVHREPFRARGIDPGEIRFDLARVVTFRR